MKKVLVFGVFDKLHPGHHYFLESARALGDELMAVVARDTTVFELKKKTPRDSETARINALIALSNVSQASLGDLDLGTYQVLQDYSPHIIALGYDQSGLKFDLERRMSEGLLPRYELVVIDSHKPEMYKSSLM